METFSALLAICTGNSPVTGEFPAHKGQRRGALMFFWICARINGWVNNREAGDLMRHRAHYEVIVMYTKHDRSNWLSFFGLSIILSRENIPANKMLTYVTPSQIPIRCGWDHTQVTYDTENWWTPVKIVCS